MPDRFFCSFEFFLSLLKITGFKWRAGKTGKTRNHLARIRSWSEQLPVVFNSRTTGKTSLKRILAFKFVN